MLTASLSMFVNNYGGLKSVAAKAAMAAMCLFANWCAKLTFFIIPKGNDSLLVNPGKSKPESVYPHFTTKLCKLGCNQ